LSIGVASAEVTITGFIDQAVQTTSTTTGAGVKSTVNSIASNLNGQSQISFNITEDLGDGMSGYATFAMLPGVNGSDASVMGDAG
jgi:predicted porin